MDVKEDLGNKIEDAIRRHIRPLPDERRRGAARGDLVIGVINTIVIQGDNTLGISERVSEVVASIIKASSP